MAIQYGDLGVCERCRRVVPASGLSDQGLCGACAVPGRVEPEMAMAASLDMEAIVRDVVEAGLGGWVRGLTLTPEQKEEQARISQIREKIRLQSASGMDERAVRSIRAMTLKMEVRLKRLEGANRKDDKRQVAREKEAIRGYILQLAEQISGSAGDSQPGAVGTYLRQLGDAQRLLAA